ncbi:MAG: alanine--tRNA ligase [candidate division KSB1 bacterium]|nr:alanine--tRNA ligase [candidate division KSB1 bacterium]MDZ7399750.1 alanine--tRNA ligase [candidate division KSB1 bacterium]
MTSNQIRESFIKFFEHYDHKFVRSSPVVPYDDPTLLFTNAGMNQFKNIFLGLEQRDYKRAANTQKCIRVSGKHNDLEEVGKDTYHHTFFEMLGNWSFGDYYKKEAIAWAWELLTEVWKLPKDKLWATVFREDDEAEQLWKKVTDIRKDQVLRFDEKDNFWEMGEVGPCGPCSEIHIDLGPERCDKKHVPGHQCRVNGGCARFIELWNLVFIQYNREEDGSLKELPAKHVDTGMGFERIVAVLQGVGSNYDTDLFRPLINHIAELSGQGYMKNNDGVAHRVIADHVRALTFAIADGALPSNEGRGYVLRRILRRAARFARKLDLHEPMIYKLVPTVVDVMGEAFPEIKEKHQYIASVIKSEEERFNVTLDRGIELFEKLAAELAADGRTQIPGSEAFRLYDTYGFPLDLTRLMAEEKNLTVDEAGFQQEMERQRERSRAADKFDYDIDINFDEWEKISSGPDSKFLGYEQLEADVTIRLLKRKEDFCYLILDQTPFYGEAGGQVGDQGEIAFDDFVLNVTDTIRYADRIVHIARGFLPDPVPVATGKARVKRDQRMSTARNHTATHLLQAALRQVLGKHVQQAGSLVTPFRLRFDLTHFERIAPEQLKKIERIVNEKIWENIPLQIFYTSFDEARNMGAMALFGEKYGERVRVIKIDDFSMELCGGTHVTATGQIGMFRIVSESSVAAGIRRIEAITGEEAYRRSLEDRSIIEALAEQLNAPAAELTDRVRELLDQNRSLEKQLQQLRIQTSYSMIDDWIKQARYLDHIALVVKSVQFDSIDQLKQVGDVLRERLKSGVGLLGMILDSKINFLCVVTDDLIRQHNLKAGDIVKEVASIAGGSGGGRPHMALAGAKDLDRFELALAETEKIVRKRIANQRV